MPPPSPWPPLDPAVMIDELVEEFLLRLPPEDPALLARAAHVSRQWYRVVTGPSFHRRFRELHRSTPPLLGYVVTVDYSIRFVPLSSFRPPRTPRGFLRAVSSSHGRVLLHRLFEKDLIAPRDPYRVKDVSVHLSVWHPLTDEQHDLPVVPLRPKRYKNIFGRGYRSNWDAAVVCAVGGDGCDHLRCPFMVVFMGTRKGRNFSCFYLSEVGCWSDPVFTAEENTFVQGHCVLIGTALYTTTALTDKIFKYDLETHQVCNIPITPGCGRLIGAEDGRLGFVEVDDSTLRLSLREENGRLEETRAIDLRTLLPADAFPACVDLDQPWVIAFAETGAGVVFLRTCIGYFTINLNSGSCKKVGKYNSFWAVPYVNFCIPAPGAGVAISSDEVPVADIAVSTHKRDQELLLWSLQMGVQELLACFKWPNKKLKLQVLGPQNEEANE